jgi:hypothetical protein
VWNYREDRPVAVTWTTSSSLRDICLKLHIRAWGVLVSVGVLGQTVIVRVSLAMPFFR